MVRSMLPPPERPDGAGSALPPAPPPREVREGFSAQATSNFFWFLGCVFFASLIWSVLS